ncbi:MAG: hypothetical protein AVDCRST_MAG54-567, partial [uncultured Actinomycetospora sp.]
CPRSSTSAPWKSCLPAPTDSSSGRTWRSASSTAPASSSRS